MSGKNLLNSLAKKENQTETTGIISTESTSDQLPRGEVLTETPETVKAQDTAEKTVKNPEDWSKDSALKEVVKLREENKAVRLRFQEQLDKIEKETQSKIEKIKEEAQTALEAKKKLEALEAEQADKKRSIEEKLANREARLAEVEVAYTQKLEEKERELATFKSKALQYEAEQEARRQVYRDKIQEELAKIPEEFRSFADKMVKGYEDPHEAWVSLAEAQRMGMFGEKKIVVNHSVPGASDGARVNKTKMEEAEKEAKSKMSSKDLIRIGLNKAKNGQNTAFRGR